MTFLEEQDAHILKYAGMYRIHPYICLPSFSFFSNMMGEDRGVSNILKLSTLASSCCYGTEGSKVCDKQTSKESYHG